MAQPSTRGELIDYCKRQLGAPVLEINVADEQIEDIVYDVLIGSGSSVYRIVSGDVLVIAGISSAPS